MTELLADLPIEFIGSFPDALHRLDPILPEIVVLGRSNVGKSTLINAVVGRKIARTSSTPGKTQHLNVFRFPTFYLIDLPGYGYAKLSQAERRRLKDLVHNTIQRRPDLAAALWLLDIRHKLSKEDWAMHDLLADSKREAIIALTKADKLARSKWPAAAKARAAELEIGIDDLVVTSGATGTGTEELGELILDVVSPK